MANYSNLRPTVLINFSSHIVVLFMVRLYGNFILQDLKTVVKLGILMFVNY